MTQDDNHLLTVCSFSLSVVFYLIAFKLKDYFEQEKFYLQGNLKITEVAGALATNRTYLSDVIRAVYNSNERKMSVRVL